jgi:hypothetical protein
VVALVALPTGALIAALRTLSNLEPASAAAGYIAALILLLVTGALLLGSLQAARTAPTA